MTMINPSRRFWILAVRHDGRFVPEFGSFVRGEVIVEMSARRRNGVRRSDMKIVAADPDRDAVKKAVAVLNDA
jgi:hypothetical protein